MSKQRMAQGKLSCQPQRQIGNSLVELPMCIVVIAFIIMVGFQTNQLVIEQERLQQNWDSQTTAHADAEKLRSQFEAIASGAAKLADAGNQNASAIVAALNKAGVTINAVATPES